MLTESEWQELLINLPHHLQEWIERVGWGRMGGISVSRPLWDRYNNTTDGPENQFYYLVGYNHLAFVLRNSKGDTIQVRFSDLMSIPESNLVKYILN
jgi:hypothetical protein